MKHWSLLEVRGEYGKNMDIKVDNLKVLSSGTLVVGSEQVVSFIIGNMTFIFDFINDNTQERDVRQDLQGKTMYTHLINFNRTSGSGIKKPTIMATLSTGEKLYFSFAVYSLGESPKIFHYTWMMAPNQEKTSNT